VEAPKPEQDAPIVEATEALLEEEPEEQSSEPPVEPPAPQEGEIVESALPAENTPAEVVCNLFFKLSNWNLVRHQEFITHLIIAPTLWNIVWCLGFWLTLHRPKIKMSWNQHRMSQRFLLLP